MANLRDSFATDKTLAERFNNLPLGGRVLAEYIWIDGSRENLRSKTRTLQSRPQSLAGEEQNA